jgi:hypothetical protein
MKLGFSYPLHCYLEVSRHQRRLDIFQELRALPSSGAGNQIKAIEKVFAAFG